MEAIAAHHALTEEQRPIADAGPNERQLVTAGAGTGKTRTLIERMTHLVEEHGLAAGREVLVLSFSRDAVAEVRRRLRKVDGDARFVRAQTFDSYATRLLSKNDPEGSWSAEGFDGRIRAATRLLSSSEEAREGLADVQHLIVDEVQDLVGVRAEFVFAVLDAIGGGFTLVGDAAQSIYDYQTKGEAGLMDSAAFLSAVRARYKEDLRERQLSQNFRAKTDVARSALSAGPTLSGSSPDYSAIWCELDEIVSRLRSLGPVEGIPALLRNGVGSTAVLCRDNGQATYVSRVLSLAKVPHTLKQSARSRSLPSWIAVLLRGLDQSQLTKDRFGELAYDAGIDEQEALSRWRQLLRAVDGFGNKPVMLSRLNEAFCRGIYPDELCRQETESLVVSSVHRSKGLEFDRVVIARSEAKIPKEVADEARVLYVALTRTRSLMSRLDLDRNAIPYKVGERWGRKSHGVLKELQIHPTDIATDQPYGLVKALETQEYLATKVKAGDPVTLVLGQQPGDVPRYRLVHNGRPVAQGADSLMKTLHVHRNKRPLPTKICDLYIDSVETVAGSTAQSHEAGLGTCGVWLSPRIRGLGRLEYATGI